MAFEDLAAFIRPGFDLPVLGHSYYVPPPNARDGVWLQAIIDTGESLLVTRAVTAANRTILADDKERTAYEMALGSAYGEMLEAGIPWPVLKHAGMTAILYWTRSPEMAEKYWARFGEDSGKAQHPAASEETNSPPDGSPTET